MRSAKGCFYFTIFTLILVSLIWSGLHEMNAFADTDLSKLKLEPKESIIFKSDVVNVLRVTLTATNTGSQEVSGFSLHSYLYSNNDVYETEGGFSLDKYDIGSAICPLNSNISPSTSSDIVLCYVIPQDRLSNFSIIIYDS